jgi:hypothetical protein
MAGLWRGNHDRSAKPVQHQIRVFGERERRGGQILRAGIGEIGVHRNQPFGSGKTIPVT